MKPQPIPSMLRAWMLATRVLAYPIIGVSRYLHRRMGAPSERFQERLGRANHTGEGGVIWFHAASLGEVMQIAPLVDTLDQTQDASILVTTTTQAGADWVARELPSVFHQFVPIDVLSAVNRFLDHWSPRIAIFVEGDTWPRLVLEAQSRRVPHVLLNARHSRTRARFSASFSKLLAPFSLVTCRSQSVVDGMLGMGLSPDRVRLLPDLRVAAPKLAASSEVVQSLSQMIGSRPIWLAASTHADDEQAVFTAHEKVIEQFPSALLIIAPRHPKRGGPLQSMAIDRGFATSRRSLNETLTETTQVYIADTLGELGVFFALSPMVFVGGSFGQEGGHNPYEPASFGSAILSGPHVKNFEDAYASLIETGAAQQIEDPADLGRILANLLGSEQASNMGQAGKNFMASIENDIANYTNLIAEILHADDAQGRSPH